MTDKLVNGTNEITYLDDNVMSEKLVYGQPCCFSTRADESKKLMLIEVTNSCNLACPYCHSLPNEGGENSIDDETFVRILDECKEMRFETIVVSGGEPLVSKRIFWLADKIKERGMKADLCTNGTMIDENKAKLIAQYFPSATVTLDTIDANVYAKMKACSTKMHERGMNGIKNLIKEGVKVGVTIVLTKYNAFHIDEVINYLKGIGVAKVALLRLFRTYKSDDFEFEYNNQNILILEEKLAPFRDIKITLKGWNFETPRFPVCNAGHTVFAIDYAGYLLPCIMLRQHDEQCNLKNYTLKQIMESKYLARIRDAINKLECKECEYNDTCKKGCPATMYNISNKIASDNRCMYRKDHVNYADERKS